MHMLDVDGVGKQEGGRLVQRNIDRSTCGQRQQLVAGQTGALVATRQVGADLIAGARHCALIRIDAEVPRRLFARWTEAMWAHSRHPTLVGTVGGLAAL